MDSSLYSKKVIIFYIDIISPFYIDIFSKRHFYRKPAKKCNKNPEKEPLKKVTHDNNESSLCTAAFTEMLPHIDEQNTTNFNQVSMRSISTPLADTSNNNCNDVIDDDGVIYEEVKFFIYLLLI